MTPLRERLLQEIAAKADTTVTVSASGDMSGRRRLLRAEQTCADLSTSTSSMVRASALACAAWALLALEALDGQLEKKGG